MRGDLNELKEAYIKITEIMTNIKKNKKNTTTWLYFIIYRKKNFLKFNKIDKTFDTYYWIKILLYKYISTFVYNLIVNIIDFF